MRVAVKIILPVLLVFFHPFSGPAYPLAGPMEIKNQFPLFLHLNTPILETAAVQDSFSVQLSYSSIFFLKNSPRWSVQMDMEWAELNFRLRKTISNSLELSVDLPILSFNSGFMNNGLDWYHSTFGFPDYGRSTRPANQFLYRVIKDQTLIIEGESGKAGLGDLKISGKQVLCKIDNQPFISLKGVVELPTGDPDKGYGNGSLDLGLFFQVEKKIAKSFQATGNLGLVVPGNLKAHKTIELKTYYFGGIGLEAAVGKTFSFLGQISAQTSPFPETGIGSLDNPAVLLSIGGRYYRKRSYFELSLTEDLNTSGAPDFIINFSFKHHF